MSHDVMANTLVSNSHQTTVSNMNHKKPSVGVLRVPYITKAPIHDTIERKKVENPRVIYSIPKSKEVQKQNNKTKAFLGLEIGALTIAGGLLIGTIIKAIKNIKP